MDSWLAKGLESMEGEEKSHIASDASFGQFLWKIVVSCCDEAVNFIFFTNLGRVTCNDLCTEFSCAKYFSALIVSLLFTNKMYTLYITKHSPFSSSNEGLVSAWVSQRHRHLAILRIVNNYRTRYTFHHMSPLCTEAECFFFWKAEKSKLSFGCRFFRFFFSVPKRNLWQRSGSINAVHYFQWLVLRVHAIHFPD